MDRCTFPEEVSLFEKPCNNIAYQKTQYVDYRPTSLLSSGGSLNFTIPPTGSQYINLKKTHLQLKAKIVKADGTAPKATELVSPINLTLHSLFSQVDVQLQQQLVSSTGSQTYGYKAYMETVLEYGRGAKKSQLQAQGFYKDVAGSMDDVTLGSEERGHLIDNNGVLQRFGLFSGGTTVQLFGPLMADICQQNRLILNGVEIQIKLWPNKDTFCLMTSEENPAYKVEIVDAILKVCKVTPTPTLLVAHSAALKESNALYPYQKTQIKTFNIPSGQYNFLLDDIYQGQVPSRMIIAMVKSKGFNGDYTLNPYNMELFEISNLGVFVNDESLPGKPLQMNREERDWMSAYHAMYDGLNKDGEDWGNDISRLDFAFGYAFFVFDLLPGDQPALHKANVRIEGAFSEALSENITIIVYGKFPAMLEITEARSILI